MNYAIGLDIGGTKIEGVLVNEKGKVLKKTRVMTENKKGKDQVIANIVSVVKSLDHKGVKGVGIGMPGFMRGGKLECISNISSLKGLELDKILKRKLKHKVIIENDANCFALAEQRWGAGKGNDHVVGLIIGTGVGAGIIINGQIYSGATNGAGEFGEIMFAYENFNVESLVSGPGIERRHFDIAGVPMTVKQIYASKDKFSKQTVKETNELIGWLLAMIMNSLNPQVIVIGGGVSNSPFYNDIKKAAKKYALSGTYASCKVLKNKLGDSSGVLGAASLVFS